MKEHFRQSMAWLHTWSGLVAAWVLFFVFVTGSATYFEDEITRWMRPEIPLPTEARHPPPAVMAERALDYLARQPEAADSWAIALPTDGRRIGCYYCAGFHGEREYPRGYPSDLRVSWAGNKAWLDSTTGRELPPPAAVRATEGGELFKVMHYALHYVDVGTGEFIVAICAMLALLAIVTGIIVHKNIFKDFFTFRPGKGQRSWLDGHNVVSVLALPFFLMITYSGLAERGYMPKPVLQVPAKPKSPAMVEEALPVTRPAIPMARIIEQAEKILGPGQIVHIGFRHPAGQDPQISVDRPWGTQYPFSSPWERGLRFNARTGELLEVPSESRHAPAHLALWWVVGPHFAWFAGAGLRWLLFLSGLLGCVMIATGAVLWAVKRRARHGKESSAPSFGLRLVERLNVGVLIGLPIGVAAYFWANRLLPVTLAERADWEVHALFLTWAWMLLHAAQRPIRKAWSESLWLATAAFGLIPLLNWLTTDKHLGATIPHGDWVLAGLDLTMLALAAVFGAVAWKLRRRWRAVPAGESLSAR